ncbi:branched-chain amino acid aminotransferase [Methylobacterium aerolatum]|uniref:Branched-chain-amino-acid aminotransferase n=1 Tax=Methylobacterium aerolatum TaxID=418708 RepID=A0ABU0HTN8_9HYPH|nr:branched-chain amino acid aminotransferase [Methylobacterium aerolatum]MDQ0445686.1 branched-chain amino acid aminotransferase [Methylobacterium aerolatum]GJD36204.1 Branched-chain-amino-acid aminotransferase [Methylobacterium aerolatum]
MSDLTFETESHASPRSVEERTALMANPGFGKVFTDHMVIARYSAGRGWHDAKVTARAPLPLDPAAAVLHYAQEIFEGLKAYRTADGGAALFRPEANARRFRLSAERMAMAPFPEEAFIEAQRRLVEIDRAWIPDTPGGSLYLRPFMIATEVFLGVKPASEYLFVTIASAVGSYFKDPTGTVTVWLSEHFTRAAPGGTGAAKCGGNYAASLAAQAEAARHQCEQVVFLDAAERRYIEELGGMNVFFVFGDGTLVTPPLSDSILPGITRDSIITLAREDGLTVREVPYTIDAWREDVRTGRLTEAFACGTAAVITPIGRVRGREDDFTIGNAVAGPVAQRLRTRLVDIQRGLAEDRHGWFQRVF